MYIENIAFACNAEGNKVLPEDAVAGVLYHCPYCGVKVYRNISVNGKPFYAVYPGCTHTAPQCEMISMQTTSAKRRYALERTNPTRFIRALLQEPGQSAGQTSISTNVPAPATNGAIPQDPKPLRSLAELYNSGVCFAPRETRMGNGCVGDCCCCTEPAISGAVDDPFFTGEMIFFGGVDGIEPDDYRRLSELIGMGKPRLAFALYSKYGTASYRRKYLVIECKTVDLLDSIINALYDRSIDANGQVVYRTRCHHVLVAGDWRRGTCNDCPHSCSRESRKDCKGVLITKYVSAKQLYGILRSEEDAQDAPQKADTQQGDSITNGTGSFPEL